MIQNYKISISKNAVKFINKQDVQQRKRILSAIYKLPFGDVKKLKGNEFYRLRIGDFRVLFTKSACLCYPNIKTRIVNRVNCQWRVLVYGIPRLLNSDTQW